MDYGAIGAIIGHEISHSFDDQGALFDASGRLHNWWTPEDFAHFKASSAQLVAQFNAYQPFPDLAVNGKQTLSENIADVAGLRSAYDAYRISLRGKTAPAVQGFTRDQQFFLSFAQSWRQKIRERLCASASSPTATRPPSIAPTRCATSMPGTALSPSSRARRYTSPRPSAFTCGERARRRLRPPCVALACQMMTYSRRH